MSADADFTLTTPALIKAAESYTACQTFHITAGESRHHCSLCGASDYAHIIVALRTALHAERSKEHAR